MSGADLVVGVRLKADGSGLVGQAKVSADAIEGVGKAAVTAGVEARALTSETAAAAVEMRNAQAAASALAADQQQVGRAVAATTREVRGAVAAMDGIGSSATTASTGARSLATETGAIAGEMRTASAAASALAADQQQVGRAIEAAASDARAASAAIGDVGAATAAAGNQARDLTAGASSVAGGMRAASTAATELAADQRQVARAFDEAAAAAKRGAEAVNDNAGAANDNKGSARNDFAVRNAGQQVQDFAQSVQGGMSVAQAFNQQIGQVSYALSEMGGAAGKVGAFLTGPWGIALTIAVSAAAPFIEKLFEASKAADEQRKKLEAAVTAADSYGHAQSALGQVIDLTTGKLKTQNTVLVQTIKLQAQANILAAQAEQKKATERLAGVGNPTLGEGYFAALGGVGSPTAGAPGANGDRAQQELRSRLAPVQNILADYNRVMNSPLANSGQRDSATQNTIAALDALSAKGQLAGRDLIDLKTKVLDLARTINDQDANRLIVDAIETGNVDPKLKPYEAPKKTRTPKPKSTAARDEFGRDAADRIAAISERFDDTPPMVRQVAQARRQLADLMDDLERRKPPGFEHLIAQAKEAGVAIEAGLNRPIDQFLDAQREQLQVGALLAQGREIEADALRIIMGLERQRGPLSKEQRAEIVASVAALRQQERALEAIHAVQQVNLNALQDMRGIIAQSIYEGPQSIEQLPGRLMDSFRRFQAELISEQLFGEMFRDMRDQVLGANKVDAASDHIIAAFTETAAAARQLSGALSGAATGTPSSGQSGSDGDEIVVTAKRTSDIYGDAIAKGLGKIGLGQDAAKEIGKFAGRGMAGAFEGQAAAGIAGLFGIKTNQTGSAIGGALGGLTGIPGMGFAGGLVGGLVGNLFAPKARPGGVTVSNVDGEAARSGTTGGDRAAIRASGGLGDSVSGGLNQIVERLGGELGQFSVSIGKYKDDLRVNENGRALGGVKNSGAVGFGDDQQAAVNYAISRAIAQGAVQGLSPAVARALQSSTDIDKALAEALKVSDLEKLLGGVTGQIETVFRDFDRTAADRVSLAKKYGFDLLQVERINGEERAKLIADTLASRVGSIKDALADLEYGDLFEGTASERRDALLGEIATAQREAEAGVAGAADRLSELFRTLVGTSKEAFGTAGPEYGSDRDLARESLNRVLQIETDRINAAAQQQQAAIDATKQVAANTDEAASLIAAGNEHLAAIAAALTGARTNLTPNLNLVSRGTV